MLPRSLPSVSTSGNDGARTSHVSISKIGTSAMNGVQFVTTDSRPASSRTQSPSEDNASTPSSFDETRLLRHSANRDHSVSSSNGIFVIQNERRDSFVSQRHTSLPERRASVNGDGRERVNSSRNEQRFSNTSDFQRVASSSSQPNRRQPGFLFCLWSCQCLTVSLLTAVLLSVAFATIISLIVLKPIPTLVTTQNSTSPTSTSSSTSLSTTTSTSTACTPPVNPDLYINGSTSIYMFFTHNFTASATGAAVLEFGFTGQTGNDFWHLDDVSLLDTNASNAQMLTNGDFENGTLNGWQVLCTANCQSASQPGMLSSTSCKTGAFCYSDGCKIGVDFLRQVISVTAGHVYSLSFWIQPDSRPQQHVYVHIF